MIKEDSMKFAKCRLISQAERHLSHLRIAGGRGQKHGQKRPARSRYPGKYQGKVSKRAGPGLQRFRWLRSRPTHTPTWVPLTVAEAKFTPTSQIRCLLITTPELSTTRKTSTSTLSRQINPFTWYTPQKLLLFINNYSSLSCFNILGLRRKGNWAC